LNSALKKKHEFNTPFLQTLSLFARLAVERGQKNFLCGWMWSECTKELEQLSVENALLSNKDNSLIFPS